MDYDFIFNNTRDFYHDLMEVKTFGEAESSKQVELGEALQLLQELGKNIEIQDSEKYEKLSKLKSAIITIDSELLAQLSNIKAKTIHQLALSLTASIDQSVLDEFLKFPPEEQEQKLKNRSFAEMLYRVVLDADQMKVRDTQRKDVLLHQLCRSQSAAARQLVKACLEAKCDINTQNINGTTALHLLALYGDEDLVNLFLAKGANPQVVSPRGTPVDIAISNDYYSVALQICLSQPNLKINDDLGKPLSSVEFFLNHLENVNSTRVIALLDRFFTENKMEDYAEKLWEALECQRSFAPETSEDILIWMLDHKVEAMVPSANIFEMMRWLAARLFESNFSGTQAIEKAKKFIQLPLFPNILLYNGKSILSSMREHPNLPAELRDEVKAKATEKAIHNFEAISQTSQWLPRNFNTLSFVDLKTAIQEVDKALESLKNENFPNIELVASECNSALQTVRECLKAVENIDQMKMNYNTLSNSVKGYLIEYCIEKRLWSHLAEFRGLIFSAEQITNKTAYHLMMDKMLFPESKHYEGFHVPVTAHAIIRSIERIGENELHQDVQSVFREIKQNLPAMLADLIILNEVDNPFKFSKKIVDQIKNMKKGESFLIPTGKIGHATSLMVSKTGPEKFRLTQYNTGQGVKDWHYTWKESEHLYQTFYEIDDIPIESLIDKSNWESLYLRWQFEEKSMDPIYMIIRDELGKGGKVLPPSEHEEDYETKQATGTCTLQALMAFFRHQVMQVAQGSPAEKKALYKLLKAKMYIAYEKENLPLFDEKIKQNLPTIMGKAEAEIKFNKIASDPIHFKKVIEEIFSILEKLDQQGLVEELQKRNTSTNMERYALLRSASSVLCGLWLILPAIDLGQYLENESLQLAIAKFEHRSAVMRNIKERFQQTVSDPDKYMYEICRIIGSTSYSDIGYQEAVQRLSSENPEQAEPELTRKLLLSLNKFFPKQSKTIAMNLADSFEKSGNQPLANWIKNNIERERFETSGKERIGQFD